MNGISYFIKDVLVSLFILFTMWGHLKKAVSWEPRPANLPVHWSWIPSLQNGEGNLWVFVCFSIPNRHVFLWTYYSAFTPPSREFRGFLGFYFISSGSCELLWMYFQVDMLSFSKIQKEVEFLSLQWKHQKLWMLPDCTQCVLAAIMCEGLAGLRLL